MFLKERNKVKGQKTWITTVNPEFVMATISDEKFLDIINKSDVRTIDGIGLIWAREVLKTRRGLNRWLVALKLGVEILGGKWRDELISGSDLIVDFCKMAVKNNEKIFFLGGFDDRAKRCGEYFSKKFKGLKYDFSEGIPGVKNEEVLKKINTFLPDYLVVAYGMKKQEEWIENNLKKLKLKVVVGVGRSFDYYSGALKRAPKWVRKMGLEWLYSLLKDPKRWKRQLVLPRFIWMVMNLK
ncbi:MAG TPA: WecB/TagA/CpsF family glycosyltransferase [Candidatus Methanoperedens sp.]|nr:WecB/TagA/CpsF family glycosyltransferase [Candidatus Methanoperedens sp.]